MAETLYTIQEAAEAVGKSVQTIRRALKSRKLIAKKQKTPQGFNYLVGEEALFALYKVNRSHASIKSSPTLATAEQTSLVTEFASKEEVGEQKRVVEKMVDENRKDKETFMRFVKVFQDRFTALENQVKLLEEPGAQKRWFQFWKKA
jgi:predicted transcriptional regulator